MSINEPVIGRKCTPGDECRLTVENHAKVKNAEKRLDKVELAIDGIWKEIRKLVYGVAGTIIILLLQWIWQMAQKNV